jgi:succinate-acetate transporter protein
MKANMVLGALFFGVGVVLLVVGGWFGLMVGVVALLMALVLVARGYRLRSARS